MTITLIIALVAAFHFGVIAGWAMCSLCNAAADRVNR